MLESDIVGADGQRKSSRGHGVDFAYLEVVGELSNGTAVFGR